MIVQGLCQFLCVSIAALLGGATLAEAGGIAPSTNGQTDECSGVGSGPDIRGAQERGVALIGRGQEERRGGESGDDVSDTLVQVLVGWDILMPPFTRTRVRDRTASQGERNCTDQCKQRSAPWPKPEKTTPAAKLGRRKDAF